MLQPSSSLLPSSSTDTLLLAPSVENAAKWAKRAAHKIERNFICDVAKLPSEPPDHPSLSRIADLLLPPHTHLLLYGTSHIRSVRSVIVSVARFFGRDVKSDMVSQSDDCDNNSSAHLPPPNLPSHLVTPVRLRAQQM